MEYDIIMEGNFRMGFNDGVVLDQGLFSLALFGMFCDLLCGMILCRMMLLLVRILRSPLYILGGLFSFHSRPFSRAFLFLML